MEQKNKSVNRVVAILLFVAVVLASLAYPSIVYFDNSRIKNLSKTSFIIESDYKFYVDVINVTKKNGFISIEGIALRENYNTGKRNVNVVLFNEKENEYLQLPSTSNNNFELPSGFVDTDVSYNNSGFLANVSENKLNKDVIYTVCIQFIIDGNDYLVKTDEVVTL